jgi:hypothetical protein
MRRVGRWFFLSLLNPVPSDGFDALSLAFCAPFILRGERTIMSNSIDDDPIGRARRALFACDPDACREVWFQTLCAAKSAGLDEEYGREWSKQSDKFNERDFSRTWRGIESDGGIKPASLFKLAGENGWREPANGRPPRRPWEGFVTTATETPKLAEVKDFLKGRRHIDLWATSKPAHAHPYVLRKRLDANPLRVSGSDLLVPLRSLDGALVTIQRIAADGTKLNLKGRPLEDSFFHIGTLDPASDAPIYLAEGVATASAIARALPHAAVLAVAGVGRFARIGHVIRQHCPAAPLVLVSDRGAEDGARKAAKMLVCSWVPMPEDRPAGFDAFDLEDQAAAAAEDLEAGSAALATWLRAHEDAEFLPAKIWTPPAITLDRLIANPPPKPRYVIEGRLTVGLHVVAGRPKQGKSLLTMDWGLSIASGTASWGAAVDQGHVWLLDLENGTRRAYERLTGMGVTPEAARHITITTEWERGNRDAFRSMLDKLPGLKLVVIDIWKKFCAPLDRRQDQYEQETAELQWLAAEANARGLAIVAVVHTVKTEVAGDVYSTIGGSNAVAGNPEGLFVLRKETDADRRTLHMQGRDIPDQKLALRIGADLRFTLLCADADAMASDDQLRYLRAIRDGHHMPSDLRTYLDVSQQAVWKMLARLHEMHLIHKPGGLPTLTPIGLQMLG